MTSAVPPGDARACPSCGSGVDPQAGFCTACGAPLRARRVPPALWAIVAALVVGAIAVVVMARGGDDGVGDGPVVVADPVEVIETTTDPDTPPVPPTAGPTTAVEPTTSTPASSPPPTTPVTTIAPSTTLPPSATAVTTVAPDTTGPPPPTAVDAGTPGFFATPDEAIADHLSLVAPPYAGPCASLAGQEVELGGMVSCSVLDQDLQPRQIHRWGVFATDDLRGWLLLDVGSAGWSVADETFEMFPPQEWT